MKLFREDHSRKKLKFLTTFFINAARYVYVRQQNVSVQNVIHLCETTDIKAEKLERSNLPDCVLCEGIAGAGGNPAMLQSVCPLPYLILLQ